MAIDDNGPPVLCLNGKLVPEGEATISPFDHGITVGDGVFETLRTFGPDIFAWSRHHDRLCHSAAVMGLDTVDSGTLRQWAEQVVAANKHPHSRVRVTLTGGTAAPSTARGNGSITVLITATPLQEPPDETTVVTVPWTRNERSALVGLKTTSYGENVRALGQANAHGATEALFANTRDQLCEGTGTNIFLDRNGGIHTPPLSSGCLAGVTRALVLELAVQEGIPVHEVPLPFTALTEAHEAFLTSTTRSIQGIRAIDGRVLANCNGEITRQLSAVFAKLVQNNLDP